MIAVDWGTSSFRAYRLDAQGDVLDRREAAQGILSVAPGGFAAVLEQQLAGWNDAPIVMSGMVGSRQGWMEVPYAQCPASLDSLAASLKKVPWKRDAWIVPGVSSIDENGIPDVMRGEETQLLGAAARLPDAALVCLPGTHSKWARMEDGRIAAFKTHMTGEVFAVLRQHSLLGRMMEEGPPEETAFAEGVARSGEDGGLLHHLFGVRTRGLFGELSGKTAPSYLSGLLLGHELRHAGASRFYLLGSPDLCALYARAAALLGMETSNLDPLAATRALFQLGRKIGV